MIKTIVFDLGGVFFTEGKSVALKNLKEKYNYDKEIILPLISARLSKKSNDAHKGILSEDNFWQWVQENLPEKYEAEKIRQEWWDGYVLDKDVCRLVTKLKNNYKLVVFSGNFKSRVEYLEGKYDFKKLFDEEIYSFDAHINKSGEGLEFLRYMLEKIKNDPQEVVYIDNGKEFVEMAISLGLKGLVYKTGGIDKLKSQMVDLGIKL